MSVYRFPAHREAVLPSAEDENQWKQTLAGIKEQLLEERARAREEMVASMLPLTEIFCEDLLACQLQIIESYQQHGRHANPAMVKEQIAAKAKLSVSTKGEQYGITNLEEVIRTQNEIFDRAFFQVQKLIPPFSS